MPFSDRWAFIDFNLVVANSCNTGAFDITRGYIYWVTFFSPSTVIKTQPTTGSNPMVRVAALTLTLSREAYASAIVADYIVNNGWVVSWGNPGDTGRITRITLPSGNTAPAKVNAQSFPAGFEYPSAMVMDLSKANILIGFNTAPGVLGLGFGARILTNPFT